MDFLPEIREYLFNDALNALSIIRWTLLEQQMNGDRASDFLDALLAYRDSDVVYYQASEKYKSFLKLDSQNWEQEEELYEEVRKARVESDRAHQAIEDMLLESDEYKRCEEELPYGEVVPAVRGADSGP
jgi:hypothetical protein